MPRFSLQSLLESIVAFSLLLAWVSYGTRSGRGYETAVTVLIVAVPYFFVRLFFALRQD
jgi:hypothetical protein